MRPLRFRLTSTAWYSLGDWTNQADVAGQLLLPGSDLKEVMNTTERRPGQSHLVAAGLPSGALC